MDVVDSKTLTKSSTVFEITISRQKSSSPLCGLLRIHALHQKHFIKNNTYLTITGIEIRLQKGFDPIVADKTCVLLHSTTKLLLFPLLASYFPPFNTRSSDNLRPISCV